jgi:hypothetical protein
MTGHFTSYENRTDHELATEAGPRLVRRSLAGQNSRRGPGLAPEGGPG